ncbi:MAG: PepSY domain-containing protein [Gammaproteobacteria bacterium]|nr:PepSY domain-containing protein [Gammaproteobacteria bacterium]
MPAKPAAQTRVSLKDATAIVRQAYGGRVVSAAAARARPEPDRGRESGYRVRVDIDGRVKTVFVDDRGRIHENAEY